MTLFCPVSGLKVETRPEWVDQQASETLTSSFWLIDDTILYSLPRGFSNLEGVRNALSLNSSIADAIKNGKGPYTQIEDYSFLAGSSSEARRYVIKNMNQDERRLFLIFCNLSHPLSIAVRIGKRFNSSNKLVHVAKHYRPAIEKAVAIRGSKPTPTDVAPIDLAGYVDDTHQFLRPVELLFRDDWNIHTPSYSNDIVLIDQSILHSTSTGYLHCTNIQHIDRTRSQCRADMSEANRIDYIMVDCSQLTGGSRAARMHYMTSLKNWHRRFPFRMYVVYGANQFMKTALHIARPLMPFQVKIAKDRADAFALIHGDRSISAAGSASLSIDTTPASVTHEDIQDMMGFIGSINWESEGIDHRVDVDEKHPFFFLYQSLCLIKEELDDLFKERRQLEEDLHQSRKMESIGSLAGGIAHDFNNILFPIIGASEMLLEDLSPDSFEHENAQLILDAGKRGRELVKRILSFSRQSDHIMAPLQLPIVIKEVLKLSRSVIPADISIAVDIRGECSTVMADATQIHQVAMNLIVNAYHAVQATGGGIVVRLREEEIGMNDMAGASLEEGRYAVLSITDNGHGMAPEVIAKVFDPYFTTKKHGKGTGLGLSVAYGIVKQHKGDIKVSSQEGQGTTFSIYLPVMEASPECAAVGPEEMDLKGSERILLVDDEKMILNVEKQILERLGYQVTSCVGSVEALNTFKADPVAYDIVITDMTMPKMTGDKLARNVLSIRPGMPVIICTGFSERLTQDLIDSLSIRAILKKPIRKSELAQAVRKVLDENRSLSMH